MKSCRQKRFGIVVSGQLVSGKSDDPGPVTFSSVREAEAELRFRPRHKAKIVEVTLSFKTV